MSERPPLVWKVPPWQPALAFVVAAGAAAIAIYAAHDLVVRVLCAAVAVAAAGGGIVAARAYLVVDDDGIGWRRVRREVSFDWAEVDSVQVTRSKLQIGLAVVTHDRRVAAIPPLLVLPTRPMKNPDVLRLLESIARDIMARRPA